MLKLFLKQLKKGLRNGLPSILIAYPFFDKKFACKELATSAKMTNILRNSGNMTEKYLS